MEATTIDLLRQITVPTKPCLLAIEYYITIVIICIIGEKIFKLCFHMGILN